MLMMDQLPTGRYLRDARFFYDTQKFLATSRQQLGGSADGRRRRGARG